MNSALAWFLVGLVFFAIIIFIILFPPVQLDNINSRINEVIPGCDTFDRTIEKMLKSHGKTVQTLITKDKELHYIQMIAPSTNRRVCLIITSKDSRVEVDRERIIDIVRQTPKRNVFVATLEPSSSEVEVRAITTSNVIPRFQLSFE